MRVPLHYDRLPAHVKKYAETCGSPPGADKASAVVQAAVSQDYVGGADKAPAAMQAAVSQDYIGGLSLSSAEQAVVVAAADGSATLLDMRRSGAEVSRTACGAPLHCVASDGRVALLGREDGQVCAAAA